MAIKPYPASAEAVARDVVDPNAITPHVPVVVPFEVMKMYCALPPVAGMETIVLAPPKDLTVSATGVVDQRILTDRNLIGRWHPQFIGRASRADLHHPRGDVVRVVTVERPLKLNGPRSGR